MSIRDKNDHVIGFLDGGIPLNNSTQLVDQISNPIIRNAMVSIVVSVLSRFSLMTYVWVHKMYRWAVKRVQGAQSVLVFLRGSLKSLETTQEWLDRAYVCYAWYITAYQPPIHDQFDNALVGMLYTGYLIWPLVETYLTNLGEISITTLPFWSVRIVHRGVIFQPNRT